MIELVNSLPSYEELQNTIEELGVETIELIQYKSAYVLLFDGFDEVGVYFFFTHEYFDGDMIYVGGAGPVDESSPVQVIREETLLYDDFEISVVAARINDETLRSRAKSVTVRFDSGAVLDCALNSDRGFMVNITDQSYSSNHVVELVLRDEHGIPVHIYTGSEKAAEVSYMPGILR